MNADQAERFQELLEEACDHYIEYDGGKIISGTFVREDNEQCPLTCLFGRQNTEFMAEEANQLLETTTVSSAELWALVSAFDNVPYRMEVYREYVSALLIGKALRAKYIKS